MADEKPGPCPWCGGESDGSVMYSCPLQTRCNKCGSNYSFGKGIEILDEKAGMRKRPGMYFSFCETIAATGPWHLRMPTMGVGLKYSGGADTPTLCGLKAEWDTRGVVTHEAIMRENPGQPGRTCAGCREKYKEMIGEVDSVAEG